MRGVPSDKRKAAIKRAADLTGLSHMISRDIHELSKGYRQRVGLAQAIIHEPDVVILDEPTSGLDPNQILEIRDLIKEIGKQKTVIFSTHILGEVSAVCDRIIVINQGKIVADDTFEALSKRVARGNRGVFVQLGSGGHVTALKAIEHVTDVTEVADHQNTYRLATEMEDHVRRAVLKWAAGKDIDVLEIRAHRPDLEETFRALTNPKGALSTPATAEQPSKAGTEAPQADTDASDGASAEPAQDEVES